MPHTSLQTATVHPWRIWLELAFLGAVWGGSFIFMRIAAPDIGAIPLVELRLASGALVLLPFLWRDRAGIRSDAWPLIAMIALLTAAVPFLLFAWAAQRAPAGVVAITNSLAVLFTALVAGLVWREHIGRLRWIALVTGFVGVAVLASAKVDGMSIGWAASAGTMASLLYGFGGNLLKHKLQGMPPNALAAATLGCGALALLPIAVMNWPSHAVETKSWLAAAVLGVLCTGVANAVYFHMILRIGAVRASTVTYLVPLFAIAWAWVGLGEPLTLPMAIAATLILGSVALTQGARKAA